MTFNVSSSAFAPKASMPTRYTCEGGDISPPLEWSGAPPGTKSFALIVEDPDAPDPAKPTRVVSHWVVYNIPASTTKVAENASKTGMPAGSAQGSNERGDQAYRDRVRPSDATAISSSFSRSIPSSKGSTSRRRQISRRRFKATSSARQS